MGLQQNRRWHGQGFTWSSWRPRRWCRSTAGLRTGGPGYCRLASDRGRSPRRPRHRCGCTWTSWTRIQSPRPRSRFVSARQESRRHFRVMAFLGNHPIGHCIRAMCSGRCFAHGKSSPGCCCSTGWKRESIFLKQVKKKNNNKSTKSVS